MCEKKTLQEMFATRCSLKIK